MDWLACLLSFSPYNNNNNDDDDDDDDDNDSPSLRPSAISPAATMNNGAIRPAGRYHGPVFSPSRSSDAEHLDLEVEGGVGHNAPCSKAARPVSVVGRSLCACVWKCIGRTGLGRTRFISPLRVLSIASTLPH